MILHDYELSANCYKVRLLAGLLGVGLELRAVDFFPGREHRGEAFRAINPLGHIPVLDDDGYVLRDAHAILVYLAARYDQERTWYPVDDARRLGQVASWMLFAEATTASASAARLHDTLGYPFDIEPLRAEAHRLFRVLDDHLWFAEQDGQRWVVPGERPTLAEIALFPDVMLSDQGGINLGDYPSLRRWCDRVKRVPGFTVMSGIYPA